MHLITRCAPGHSLGRWMTSVHKGAYQNDDCAHSAITQRLPVVIQSCEVNVVNCEVHSLVHVVNVRVLDILEAKLD